MPYPFRTWYLTAIAGFYLVICSFNVLYLAGRSFQPGALHSPRELLPLAAAIVSGLYLLRPRAGHRGLIALTVLVLVCIGEADLSATAFHSIILALLILPFVTRSHRAAPNPLAPRPA